MEGQANPTALLAACGTGGILYAVAGLALVVIIQRRFDWGAGRSYTIGRRNPEANGEINRGSGVDRHSGTPSSLHQQLRAFGETRTQAPSPADARTRMAPPGLASQRTTISS